MPHPACRPPLAAALLAALLAAALAAPAARPLGAQGLIVNGGFETGDLTGWTRTGPDGFSCASNWRVSAHGSGDAPGVYDENVDNGTRCVSVGGPPAGTFAAYNSLDGGYASPFTFRLEQSFVVPAGVIGATLSFMDALRWDYDIFAVPGAVKTFTVTLVDAGAATLATPHAAATAATGAGGYDWTARAFDVTAVLAPRAGQTLTLRFDATIPAPFAGPAGLGIDAVALVVTAVPEPGTMGLLGAGALVGLAGIARGRGRGRVHPAARGGAWLEPVGP